jgi:hypothetical protein
LHAKNNFALAIITGDVFTPDTDDATLDSLIDGTIEVPLPTYFTVGLHPLPPRIVAKVEANEEICPNLHFLGKRSITKTSDGIRIVALGGSVDSNLVGGLSKEQHLPFHTTDDVKSLRGANNADILLTSLWPANVWSGNKVALTPEQQASISSTKEVAELCAALKPRYHFSPSPDVFFFEREPFLQLPEKDSEPPSATRFISMAPFENDAKAKAMYAFTLNKSDSSLPVGCTSSPFESKKRPREDAQYSRFGRTNHGDGQHGRRKRRHAQSPPPGPDRCFFCLSNPNLATHMCCSIGDDAYITIAKGPLPKPAMFADKGLEFPGHLLIIPLPHAPTIPHIGSVDDPSGEAVKAYKEMGRFRESIQAMIASKSSHKLGVVTWEISRERNIHLHWQLMPLDADMIRKGLAEAAFRVEAENLGLPAFTNKELSLEQQVSEGDFFRLWLWADNGEDRIKGKSLVMPLPTDQRFDLQFGRRVMAKLLGLEDRLIWQDCEQSVEEESKDVEAFRQAFKDWDFTLE